MSSPPTIAMIAAMMLPMAATVATTPTLAVHYNYDGSYETVFYNNFVKERV